MKLDEIVRYAEATARPVVHLNLDLDDGASDGRVMTMKRERTEREPAGVELASGDYIGVGPMKHACGGTWTLFAAAFLLVLLSGSRALAQPESDCEDLGASSNCGFSMSEDGVTPDIFYASRARIAETMVHCSLIDPRVLRCLRDHPDPRVRANVRWLLRYIAVYRRSPERARAMQAAARGRGRERAEPR